MNNRVKKGVTDFLEQGKRAMLRIALRGLYVYNPFVFKNLQNCIFAISNILIINKLRLVAESPRFWYSPFEFWQKSWLRIALRAFQKIKNKKARYFERFDQRHGIK